MAKNLDISLLLDFYGDMLTPKQREVTELYYNDDLSLAEIAQHSKITRQGVRDSIKRAEFQLLDYEAKLGLYSRFVHIQNGLGEILENANQLSLIHRNLKLSSDALNLSKRIAEIAAELGNE